MCTLTVIRPFDAGHRPPRTLERIAFNRDELLTRRPGLPPRTVHLDSTTALMPLDADAGGAWIACTSHGLVLALLNRTNPADTLPPAGQTTSRGLLIPSLLTSPTLAAALAALIHRFTSTPLPAFRPFTLWLSDGLAHAVARYNGRTLTCRLRPDPPRRFILSSSSTGDHRVRAARAVAFRVALAAGPSPARAQRAFHDTFAPPPDPIGPLVHRPDARTLSQTLILRHPDHFTLLHRDLPTHRHPPDLTVPFSTATLPFHTHR